MQHELVETLRCPVSGERFRATALVEQDGRIRTGSLVTASNSHAYPIVEFVPRFVPEANYAGSFGLQWNRFRRTQLDSYSQLPISLERFYGFTGWTPEELAGKAVLDVGCGAGRFAEIALLAGAHVTAVDYSSAVDACWANHAFHPRLNVVQADAFALPFQPGHFDFVYCLGVLQHTPDPRRAFLSLAKQLRHNGKLAIDVYARLWLNVFWPKYWLRPVTRRLPVKHLFALVERLVPLLLPVSRALGRLPGLGRKLRHVLPIVNYEGVYPLSEAQVQEWALLDTFDMLSPAHDHPQSVETVRSWFAEAGLKDVSVARQGFVVGRGVRP